VFKQDSTNISQKGAKEKRNKKKRAYMDISTYWTSGTVELSQESFVLITHSKQRHKPEFRKFDTIKTCAPLCSLDHFLASSVSKRLFTATCEASIAP